MKITRVYQSAGRYYYVQDLAARNPRTGKPLQKWHQLTRVDEGEPALLAALKELLGAAAPAAVQAGVPAGAPLERCGLSHRAPARPPQRSNAL